MRVTGDIRRPNLVAGEAFVDDKGHLTALGDPAAGAVAEKYPGRPGLDPLPRSF
jgi:hypothetical protein